MHETDPSGAAVRSTRFWQCTAEIVDPACGKIELAIGVADGDAFCQQVLVTRHTLADGRVTPPITGTLLRSLPIATYVELALDQVSEFHAWERPDDSGQPQRVQTARPEGFHEPGQRRTKSELLPVVVAEYRRALSDPNPLVRRQPTEAVAERLNYARGHISRLLTEARQRGMLGAARRGKAGEASYTNEAKEGTS
jgi:hypothetical protein